MHVARRADGAVEGERLLELGVGLLTPIRLGELLGGAQARIGLVELRADLRVELGRAGEVARRVAAGSLDPAGCRRP